MVDEKEAELRKKYDTAEERKKLRKMKLNSEDEVMLELSQWGKSQAFHDDWIHRARKVLVRAEWSAVRNEEWDEHQKNRKHLKYTEKVKDIEAQQKKAKEWEKHRDERIAEWKNFQSQGDERRRLKRKARIEAGDMHSEDSIDDDIDIYTPPYKYPDQGERVIGMEALSPLEAGDSAASRKKLLVKKKEKLDKSTW
eukprot:CAMPEP_0197537752 /NCGR_PEP_ID=MMETSP1318-20131121/57812_1 /TAXON_ID=552666 /ORGANISM="Partenskyella glossopodia, Strain RCC365" /LENGTH=195 /DNA_ID=CAMNT_0043095989 /DNA_START=254 /DNA_END=838 /DNA_ORIENTATION=-